MFCRNCGKEIDDKAFCCPNCGVRTGNVSNQPSTVEDDAPNTGYAVLGFFIPLVGLILWLMWKDTSPLKAKSCGKGALIGVIVSVACYILSSVVLGATLGSLLYI